MCARWWTGAVRERRSNDQLVAEASEMGSSQGGLVKEVVNGLSEFGLAGFPVVLFVEDLHHADEKLLETLEALLRSESHLLVVTTTWPGMINETPRLSRLVEGLGKRVMRVTKEAAGKPFDPRAGFTELGSNDCKRIVLAHYPRADPQTVDLLVDRYRNPWAIELVCYMRKYRDNYSAAGDLRIAPKEIAALPKGTKELYGAYWSQLPESVRLRYAVANAISPAAINAARGGVHHTWSNPVLQEVTVDLGLPDAADLRDSIEAATDAYGWVAHVDKYLRRWCETDQQYIAAAEGTDLLDSTLLDARDQILTGLARVVLRGTAPSVHAAYTILALHAEGFITVDAPVAEAITVVLGYLSYDDTVLAERMRLYTLYTELDHTSIDMETDLEVRFDGIDAAQESGQHDLAVKACRDLHALAQSHLGTTHRETLRSHYELAGALRNAAHFSGADTMGEAVAAYEQVLDDSTKVLGERDVITVSSRRGLAVALRDVGRFDAAIDIFERMLRDSVGVPGQDVQTLFTNANLAVALVLQDAGRVDEGIAMLEHVNHNLDRWLGHEHPFTLSSRHDYAAALLNANRLDEALVAFEQVLADSERVLGSQHPHTVRYRSGRDTAAHSVRQLDDAIRAFKHTLAEPDEGLDDDPSDFLAAGHAFAVVLGKAGRLDDAIEILTNVWAERIIVLGPQDPETLASLGDLRQLRRRLQGT